MLLTIFEVLNYLHFHAVSTGNPKSAIVLRGSSTSSGNACCALIIKDLDLDKLARDKLLPNYDLVRGDFMV